MARVLLSGATGFLGGHLLHELRSAGHGVRALSRSASGDDPIRSAGAQPVRGALEDTASLAAAVDGVDAVFHAAADTSTWRGHAQRQYRINVVGTRNLLDAARRAGVRAFLHTSSVSAYSHLVHGTLREDVPQRGAESWISYEHTKHAAECAVRESDLDWIVYQPSHILGPGDRHNWSRLFALIDRDALPGAPPGSGAFADVREIARAQVRGWQQRRFGEAFLLGGEHASFLDLIRYVAQRLGRTEPKRAVPAALLRVYAGALALGARLTGREPEITPEAAAFTCHRLVVDCGKAQRQLDYRITPLHALVDDTLDWIRGAGMLTASG